MELFHYDPGKQEILYEDSKIILAVKDHCLLICPADLAEIAEFNSHNVEHSHDDHGTPIFLVDNCAPGQWLPETWELHNFLINHKSECYLEVESSEINKCADVIMLALAQKIKVIPRDETLKKLIQEVRDTCNAILKSFGHPVKKVA